MCRVLIAAQSLLFTLWLAPCPGECQAQIPDPGNLTNWRQYINHSLCHLPLERQGEYALMLYRTTGDKSYLETARITLYLSADRLQRFAKKLRTFKERRELVIQEGFPLAGNIIEAHSDYLFYGFMVLPDLNRINQFSMTLKGESGDKLDQAVNAYDFKEGLTSPELIRFSAPDLAEHVYALQNLDYGDYRAAFIEAFKRYYPDASDVDLPEGQLLNKWEAMVHLVIAASARLQEPVNDPLLNWVPEYFLRNKQLIFKRGNPAVVAKIGLVLHLTGKGDSTFLEEITKKVSATSTERVTEDGKLWMMLLLDWQENYFPDPAIYRMSRFKNKVPFSLRPLN